MPTQPSTRERITHTAMRLFLLKGYGATSIADILVETGVNSGSLYHAFPGKQDLLLAVLQAYREGIGPMLVEPATAGIDDPVERVFALLAAYRNALASTDCTYGCPIGSLALELHEPDPPVRAALAANFHAWVAAVRGDLEAAGFAHAQPLAEFALVTMEGAVMLARTHRDIGFFDRAVAQLRGHFARLKGE